MCLKGLDRNLHEVQWIFPSVIYTWNPAQYPQPIGMAKSAVFDGIQEPWTPKLSSNLMETHKLGPDQEQLDYRRRLGIDRKGGM